MSDRGIATTPPDGSYVIERYVYEGPKGGEGVQWVVYRVESGELRHLAPKDTLREAAGLVRRAGAFDD